MAYRKGKDPATDEERMQFTSKTRVGLNEEIDRFMKEKNPDSLMAESGGLVPEYFPPFDLYGESRWRLTMYAEGMVKD